MRLWRLCGSEPVERLQDRSGPLASLAGLLDRPPVRCPFGPVGFKPQNERMPEDGPVGKRLIWVSLSEPALSLGNCGGRLLVAAFPYGELCWP